MTCHVWIHNNIIKVHTTIEYMMKLSTADDHLLCVTPGAYEGKEYTSHIDTVVTSKN